MSMFTAPYLAELAGQLGTTLLDDSVDKLCCFITAFFFVVSAILISAKTYAGTPIECWVPQTYSGEWGEFAEGFCFLKDTYWYPSDASLNDISEDHKMQHRLNYYQWASIYLTIAAMLYMAPKFFWRYSQSYTYTPLPYFLETTGDVKQKTEQEREEKVREMAVRMRDRLRHGSDAPYIASKLHLINVYIIEKILYLAISLCQFVAMAFFIGQGHDVFWGWTLAKNLFNGVTWEITGLFPRITFCDFTIREMAGNNREETIQCLIGLNEFNEKIFLFLWFWVLFVTFCTCVGMLLDFFLIFKNGVIYSLLHTLRVSNSKDGGQLNDFKDFANNYLGYDGKLIICFVKRQSDLVAEELVLEMYRNYQDSDETNVLRPKSLKSNDNTKDLLPV